jgi:hypothetical protein
MGRARKSFWGLVAKVFSRVPGDMWACELWWVFGTFTSLLSCEFLCFEDVGTKFVFPTVFQSRWVLIAQHFTLPLHVPIGLFFQRTYRTQLNKWFRLFSTKQFFFFYGHVRPHPSNFFTGVGVIAPVSWLSLFPPSLMPTMGYEPGTCWKLVRDPSHSPLCPWIHSSHLPNLGALLGTQKGGSMKMACESQDAVVTVFSGKK